MSGISIFALSILCSCTLGFIASYKYIDQDKPHKGILIVVPILIIGVIFGVLIADQFDPGWHRFSCDNCGAFRLEESKFCSNCGQQNPDLCIACGGPVGTADNFCSTCGTPVGAQ